MICGCNDSITPPKILTLTTLYPHKIPQKTNFSNKNKISNALEAKTSLPASPFIRPTGPKLHTRITHHQPDSRSIYLVSQWSRLPKRDSPTDTPISSLYLLYHFIVTDNTIELRNELEFCFNKAEWPVNAIPNPKDTNPQRYAILAVLTALMCRAFNRLIAKGFLRDAPPIVSDCDALGAQPRVLEVPQRATELPKLETRLDIQDENDVFLDGPDDPKACKEFLTKNILIEEPHISFCAKGVDMIKTVPEHSPSPFYLSRKTVNIRIGATRAIAPPQNARS